MNLSTIFFSQIVPFGAKGKNADHEMSFSDEEEEEVNESKEGHSFQMVKLK